MIIARRKPFLLALLTFIVATGLGEVANAKWVFVTAGSPFRLDYSYVGGNQPGGQSTPFLTAKQPSGLIVGWVNARSSTDIRPFAHYFSDSGSPSNSTPIQLGAATGPTAGALATAAFPLSFADGSALVLFASDRRNAAAAAKKDIFGQPLSASQPYSEVGLPASVNQVKTNVQDQVMATRLSNGNVMAVFLSHAGAASTFDLKGRVVNKNGVGVASEKLVTAGTAGAQSLTSIAPLATGKSVIAYIVRDRQRGEPQAGGSGPAAERNRWQARQFDPAEEHDGREHLWRSRRGGAFGRTVPCRVVHRGPERNGDPAWPRVQRGRGSRRSVHNRHKPHLSVGARGGPRSL